MRIEHFVSETCGGESCGPCRRERGINVPATHKLGEEIPIDFPGQAGHNLTQYVCCACFARIVGVTSAVRFRGCDV